MILFVVIEFQDWIEGLWFHFHTDIELRIWIFIYIASYFRPIVFWMFGTLNPQ